MFIIPLTLLQANQLVAQLHRHHKPVTGHRFSIGAVSKEGTLLGAAIIGRPVSRELPQNEVAEITRLVTNSSKNTCSFLYGAAARICREMGFKYIQTYTLKEESGTSLIAAGWQISHTVPGRDWNNSFQRRGTRRTDQPMTDKICWRKTLNPNFTRLKTKLNTSLEELDL